MKPQAAALLAEIDAYCERTGTPVGRVGTIAFNHAGFVPLLRKRGWLRDESAAVISQLLANYPDGIPEAELHRRTLLDSLSPRVRRRAREALAASAEKAAAEAAPRVHRDPCARCGVRADIGCGHRPVKLGTVL